MQGGGGGGGGRGANEAKVDKTTEMFVLLSDPFIWESSNTWEIVAAEYYICRIQMFELRVIKE